MTIKDMHYDFKMKLDKVDSQQNRNLKVPEIDWKLNEAQEIFVKLVAEPRSVNHLGFEFSQRNIDDIRTIVVNSMPLSTTQVDDTSYYVELPDNYMFYISSKVKIKKENCSSRLASCMLVRHDDKHEEDPFRRSSYEWKEVNIRFYDKGIRIFTDGTFVVEELLLDYIKIPQYIHNAESFLPAGKYKLPNGKLLEGKVDCELPEITHKEIVDIAVFLTSMDMSKQDISVKSTKLQFNQLN